MKLSPFLHLVIKYLLTEDFKQMYSLNWENLFLDILKIIFGWADLIVTYIVIGNSSTSGLVGKWLYDHYFKLMNNCVH